MIGKATSAYGRSTTSLPKMPEIPTSERIRNYHMGPVAHAIYEVTLVQLRNALRQGDLKDEIFYALQDEVLRLLESEQSQKLDPMLRMREVVQGLMTAFVEKKMDHGEGARVAATSLVLFFPRGRVEQFDVAKLTACELMLTKINLNSEMVQMSFGVGKAFATLIGLATLLPKILNPEIEYLEKLYHEFYKGIWMGTMLSTGDSTPHGNANVAKFEEGHTVYTQELIQRVAATKAKTILGGWFGK